MPGFNQIGVFTNPVNEVYMTKQKNRSYGDELK
jgi:hypothetical protein